MKNTKETKIEYTTKSGKQVIINVHREYGSYVMHNHDSENGIDYDTNEFADDCEIQVEVVGVCKFGTRYLTEKRHPKVNMYYLSGCNGVTVCLPDDIADKIFAAQSEKLNDEIPGWLSERIQEIKNAIDDGKVMNASDLNEKKKEYNNVYNEGGEGYNPYDCYLTTEYVEKMKKQYYKYF